VLETGKQEIFSGLFHKNNEKRLTPDFRNAFPITVQSPPILAFDLCDRIRQRQRSDNTLQPKKPTANK